MKIKWNTTGEARETFVHNYKGKTYGLSLAGAWWEIDGGEPSVRVQGAMGLELSLETGKGK
jgi:hypothetical protein